MGKSSDSLLSAPTLFWDVGAV